MGCSLRRIRYCILFVLLISIFSLTALAENGSAVLNSLHFEIALQEDGSACITETREVVFNGDREFTRYGVNNVFAGPRTFTDWHASVDGTPLNQLDAPDNENRPENSFAVEDGEGENTIYIYFRQQGSGTRSFQISYRLENAVKLYSDVGEFFWNLTGETGISDIGTLTATLTVPEGVPAEDFNIWAHGPLNGNFDKQDDGSAALEIENVPLGTIVDICCTLPADCFTGGWEQQGEGLEEILAYEKELSDSANAKREEELRAQEEEERARAEAKAYWEAHFAERDAWAEEHPIQNSIEAFCDSIYDAFYYDLAYDPSTFVAILCACAFVLAAFWGRLRRNPKRFRHTPAQSPQYCRELPDDRSAPAVDLLLHSYDGKSDVSRQISAALLELNLKELVQFETVDGNVELALNLQLGEALFPSSAQQESESQNPDPGYLEILWGFLLNAADGSDRTSMKELQRYIRDNQKAAWDFRRSFNAVVAREHRERVKTEVIKHPFFGRSRLVLLLPVVAGFLAMLVCMGCRLYVGPDVIESVWGGAVTLAVAMLVLILFCIGRRLGLGRCVILDQQSEDDLAMWQAFGRFLDDFTTFGEEELPEFSVWREYMVYAIAMGRIQKLAKALTLKYPESHFTAEPSMDEELYRLLRELELHNAMNSIGREVADARQPSAPSSSSDSSSFDSSFDNWSDSSGGGGGFSDFGGGSDSGSGGDFID
ncbi:MAG: DUF2207 domain-containing protein [Eubacteriales bacterium]|nr:DUF2207 domain-containing protein [Eubacteriales bacterium]